MRDVRRIRLKVSRPYDDPRPDVVPGCASARKSTNLQPVRPPSHQPAGYFEKAARLVSPQRVLKMLFHPPIHDAKLAPGSPVHKLVVPKRRSSSSHVQEMEHPAGQSPVNPGLAARVAAHSPMMVPEGYCRPPHNQLHVGPRGGWNKCNKPATNGSRAGVQNAGRSQTHKPAF
ncbi:hypothetical protein MRX96_008396 [Rhipicephalus microplus]